MKLCSKLLVIAILASTCVMISCAGPASSSYQNVSISMLYYPICNGCGTTGTGGFTYGVNPPGDGGIPSVVYPQCAANTATAGCQNNGTVLCNANNLCTTVGAIEMPPGGGSGSCIELFANVTNAPLNPTWTIVPAPVASSATSNVGTLASQTGSTNFYCEPNSIPVYTGVQLAQARAAGIPQGNTEVIVSNPTDPANPSSVVTAKLYFAFQLLAPPTGIVVGFNDVAAGTSVTVPLGTSYNLNGYVAGIGALNTCPTGSGAAYGVTYNILPVPAGGATSGGQFGTITPTNSLSGNTVVYTAPSAYPNTTTPHTAQVTVSSTACPTIISAPLTIVFP
jgi:hypothetical protein